MGTSPGASWNLAELVACFPGLSMRQSFSEGVGGEGGWWWGRSVLGHEEAPWALLLENPIQQMGSETQESGH